MGLLTNVRPPAGRSVDQVLADARARLRRLSPAAALRAQELGALLVDIRSAAQRAATGAAPGALLVERTVLEWRFDPRSPSRLPLVDGYDQHIVIFCQQGYSSSLAAASLQDLGLHRATDMIGGFDAWRAASLPVIAARP